MSVVNLILKQPIETVYFDPPLPPAKGIQVFSYYGRFRILSLFCDIVEPLFFYSNSREDKFEPTQLPAVIPSEKYPIVNVRKSKDPINSMKFTITHENGNLIDFKEKPTMRERDDILERPFLVCLKIYH